MSEAPPWKRPVAEILHVEAGGDDRFTATLDGFGGTTCGCAVHAASLTCADRELHGLHYSFLRGVPPGGEVTFEVERVRDGRRFAHRQVRTVLDGRLLGQGMASFTVDHGGLEFQEADGLAGVPPAESLPTEQEEAAIDGFDPNEPGPFGGPIEWRFPSVPWRDPAAGTPSRYAAWVRPREALGDDRSLRAAILGYLADYHSHIPVARQLGGRFEPIGFTSLDQSLWIHRPRAWDDWWLLESESDSAHGGRALSRRRLYASDGALVATMAQEALVPASPE